MPTRILSNCQSTSPDISLASLSLLQTTEWDTTVTFSSDHVPMIISLSANFSEHFSEKRTFINFNKAKWDDFKNLTEEEFSKLEDPSNVYKGKKSFRKIINKVSNLCIPAGRITKVDPEIPSEAARKIKE